MVSRIALSFIPNKRYYALYEKIFNTIYTDSAHVFLYKLYFSYYSRIIIVNTNRRLVVYIISIEILFPLNKKVLEAKEPKYH